MIQAQNKLERRQSLIAGLLTRILKKIDDLQQETANATLLRDRMFADFGDEHVNTEAT